ncbi:serine/threonine protein kinase [Cohnella sp. CFH 77786]|uniref:serine/threonine protein kinase n=1 Tax=Cohnella sp. CFH 77786 TaxID=2662265 RepID=UPI001C60FFF9|nr:serine/threonine protein kinase [Cohnella sp. CFH 77786]MBW5447744.1 serine/threonine protein kinase [Cohnella sp. CFH 77786]
MIPDWKLAENALQNIRVIGNDNNEPVTIEGFADGLYCIGIGTDAAVFYYAGTPPYAFKVYSDLALDKKDVELEIYERIQGSPYFPQCYGAGSHYLVLSLEVGPTLYDCLLQGIHIPEQVILDVEAAREFVRSQGLNPRDIHLKNVLMQGDRAKVIDVSEYIKEGNDHRWEHLAWAYRHIYPSMSSVKVPLWILESIRHWYNRVDKASFVLENFSYRLLRLFDSERKS